MAGILRLPDRGRLLVCTDLQGCLRDYRRIVDIFLSLHRALLTHGDALVALQQAQVALLRDSEVSVAHPANWAAFVHLGGVNPQPFSKGEI